MRIVSLLLFFSVGCAFGARSLEDVDPDGIPVVPTYNKDVAPILDYYCVGCHDPGTAFFEDPPLNTFQDAKSEFDGIVKEFLSQRTMPPGGAPQPTSREREIVSRWGQNGLLEQ